MWGKSWRSWENQKTEEGKKRIKVKLTEKIVLIKHQNY